MTALAYMRHELARLFGRARALRTPEAALKVADKLVVICGEHGLDMTRHTMRFRRYCMNRIQQRAIKYGN